MNFPAAGDAIASARRRWKWQPSERVLGALAAGCIAACVGTGAYVMGQAGGVKAEQRVEIQRQAFQNSFEKARADAVGRGREAGARSGERLGQLVGRRAGARLGERDGSVAAEQAQAAIAERQAIAAAARARAARQARQAQETVTTTPAPVPTPTPVTPAPAPSPNPPASQPPCFDAAGHPC